ncbi:MAG: cysteine--tRNA ligase, partial [Nanoarchaeota archaeon]
MTLKLYNTLTRKKEEFKPIEKDKVTFYSCGPTVYNYAHIGNLRTYIFNDLLKRVLLYDGYNVHHVMNITDVGHLTDDADAGEDKMEKGARREGKSVWDIARFYAEAFQSDLKKLNILDPDEWPKATDHIQEMIDINKTIEQKGYAYQAENGNLYFDTARSEHYGELARLQLDKLNEGARTGVDENKKNPTDFVLWFSLKGSKFGESHSMKWDSPWGVGYPGWHIECCAMSSKYLGEHFDIHTGGIDHIPVHHTNEIAQAEAAFDVHPWVNYWLHANFLVIDKGKMAKSGENFLKLRLLEEKGYEPMAFRYFCLSAHYRSELTFSWEALDNAQKGYNRFRNRIIELKDNLAAAGDEDGLSFQQKFSDALDDDLNIPVALATAQEVLSDKVLSARAKYDLLLKFDRVLGLDIEHMEKEAVDVPAELKV